MFYNIWYLTCQSIHSFVLLNTITCASEVNSEVSVCTCSRSIARRRHRSRIVIGIVGLKQVVFVVNPRCRSRSVSPRCFLNHARMEWRPAIYGAGLKSGDCSGANCSNERYQNTKLTTLAVNVDPSINWASINCINCTRSTACELPRAGHRPRHATQTGYQYKKWAPSHAHACRDLPAGNSY